MGVQPAMTEDRVIRIGGATGFRVDSLIAVPQLLGAHKLDYLVFDFLAEGSMGGFGQSAVSDPAGGFAADFIQFYLTPYLHEILAKGIKVVANAGALNPRGCAAAIEHAAAKLGLAPRVAAVEGDDLRPRIDALRTAGHRDMFSGAAFPDEAILSVNAYLGGFPIAAALAKGADIVVTGRVVDSALAVGPLIHEFGWKFDDYDRLAAGTVAGHLLECGAQVTGGTYTDWRDVPDWSNIGYPIAECRADGTFTITKPPGTGGLVSVGTVAEQLLYEVSDPAAYFVPDVTADFSTVELEADGANRVVVSGARGFPPTATYKVCVTYEDGWRAIALQPIIGIDAPAKAERQADALFDRTRRMLADRNLGEWRSTYLEVLGAEASYGGRARRQDAREVIARLVVDHDEKRAAELFAREQSSSITTMSVGTSIGLGVSVSPIVNLFSFLLPKDEVTMSVAIADDSFIVHVPTSGDYRPAARAPSEDSPPPGLNDATEVPLIRLAIGRSGDKGDLFNVAVIARLPDYLPYIRAALTPAAVADWFGHVFGQGAAGRVDRFEVPGIHGLNFVVHEALGGGITSSPRLDKVAKTMAQQLLEFPIPVPRHLVDVPESRPNR
ncbi:MAG: hypothetical protein JWM91_1549 [Rhodospirillales bacterium]|nr:hypothetical protein [Rhodospirillales bacterium]